MSEERSLAHYGVLGMRWGHRKRGSIGPIGKTVVKIAKKEQQLISKSRKNEKEYREKLTNIMKNRAVVRGTMDYKLFKARNQSLPMRITKSASAQVGSMLIGDILTGGISKYSTMSKVEVAKRLTVLARNTALDMSLNAALAKSASKRYTQDGKHKGKRRVLTKELVIETGVQLAVKAIPLASWMLGSKAYQVRARRARNQADFERWGGRILTAKANNIHDL